jgi:hypothetical protein
MRGEPTEPKLPAVPPALVVADAATPDLDCQLNALARHLPRPLGRALAHARRPGATVLRVSVATLLIVGGVFGALPILGFWMIPLGLALLAQDLPCLRPSMTRALAFVNAHWPGRAHPQPPSGDGA